MASEKQPTLRDDDIRRRHAAGEPTSLIAKRYGLTPARICQIVSNKSGRSARDRVAAITAHIERDEAIRRDRAGGMPVALMKEKYRLSAARISEIITEAGIVRTEVLRKKLAELTGAPKETPPRTFSPPVPISPCRRGVAATRLINKRTPIPADVRVGNVSALRKVIEKASRARNLEHVVASYSALERLWEVCETTFDAFDVEPVDPIAAVMDAKPMNWRRITAPTTVLSVSNLGSIAGPGA